MEGDYLELSWDVVQNLVLLENKQLVQLNKEQCGLLIEKFVEIVPSVRDAVNSVPLQKRALLLFVLQELYHLVKEAEVIIRACCSEDPLKAAVKLQDSIEAFGECFFNTEWLAGLIRIVISGTKDFSVASSRQRLVEEIASFGAVCQSKEGIRRVFKAAALKDRRSLTEMLELRKSAKGVVDEQERQIVAYLLELMPSSFGGTFTLPIVEPKQLQFVKKIGSGSLGTVFEARCLGLSLALKVFQGIEKESFEKEVAALAGLHHPHVVQLLGTSLDTYRPRCSLLMELMSEDLGAYIVKRTISHSDQRPFNLPVAVDVMLQIAEGMKYLHEQRITHRNLKSSNVLVNPVESSEMAKAGYLHVKLADFGLSKIRTTSANFSSPLSVGTSLWRAPELYGMDDSYPDKLEQKTQKRSNLPIAADVFSFGLLCYEVLTGDCSFKEEKLWDHPLKEEKLGDLSETMKYARTIPQVDSPPYLSSLITMCWDADQNRRPTFSEICANLLHIKGCLLIGGEQLFQGLRSPTYSGLLLAKQPSLIRKRTMYQAFLGAAKVNKDQISKNFTRVLVLGCLNLTGSHSDMALLEHIHDKKHNGFDNTNPVLELSLEAMDINNGWMHPTVPLCIHTSKGIGDSEQLEQIKTFLAERNSLCTSSSWFAKWQEELKTGGNTSWKSFEDLNDTSKFEKQSFLKNVRESPVLDLQKQLVCDLLQEDVKSREDFNHWFDLFMGRKVLIVIDDVDEKPQFEQLIPEINKLARGSRVLVTSHDRDLVANIMEKAECKYARHEVAALNNPDARQLFNSHAFHSSNVTDGFHDVAQRIADACAGLPLALEVIGSFLFDKRNKHDLDCWEQTIKTLHEEKDILDKLKISYDGLSTTASQLMFLDIACFFIGKQKTMAMQIFESCSYDYNEPAVSFSSLMDKSLVKLDGDGRIMMHDLLRDMGREVVKNQSLMDKAPPSHLWDPEMAERVLANREGTNRVRGLSVAGKGNGAACVAENYTSMNQLHFLLLDGCDVKGDFSTWSLELSWLQWRSSTLSALPLKLDLLKLAVLDLTDSKNLTRIWPSNSELEFPCKELQTLILENCSALEELPQNFGKLSRLKDLNMRGCSTLEALPDSMGQLRELKHLNLSSCGKLGSLPDSIVHLSKLKTIQLNECTQLKSLPMAFGELQSLVEFWAEGSSLSHLPHTFSLLSNLEHLHLYKCSHIQDLPPSMSGLWKLKVLHMGQTRVQTLPQDFGKLGSLIELNLQECKSLKSLPDNFGLLSELRKLVMHHNKSFVKLPEGFGRLQALVELDLGTCSIEEKGLSSDFGNLSALRTLHLQYNKLATLPETFRDLGALVFLEMHHCPNLIDVQALPWNLEHMDIGNCPNLTDIPLLGKMSLLKCLILCNCTRLTQLQGLESLPSLVEINVAGCTTLENVSGLNHNRALEQCYLSGSKISMKYDNDWLKKQPATQVVSYYEDTLAFAHNGMAQKVTSKEWANELCMETILTNPEECIAVIFSFVAHDQGWSDYPHDRGRYNSWCSMEARVVRNNEDVYISSLFQLRHADRRDQMYLCTLRRLHPFVHALQHGDKIRVYARSSYPGWAITVEQGAVCVVHATKGELDHEKVHVVMNGGSETHPSNKSVNESLDDGMKVKLATLQLADNPITCGCTQSS